MDSKSNRKQLAREAKAIVALAFRNGPIEDLHAGKACPTCQGQAGVSRVSDADIKKIMKNPVDHVYALLCLRTENPVEYELRIKLGEGYTARWDEPKEPRKSRTDNVPSEI
jgi:hypothetical protein